MKKHTILQIIASLIAVIMVLTSFSSVAVFAGETDVADTSAELIGDSDGDGEVTVIDATVIQIHLASISLLDSTHQRLADVDNDNTLTIIDATTIQLYLAKIIPGFARKPQTTENPNINENGLATDLEQGTIFHAWCWSFNTIKNNLKNLAAAGFTSVQTSPVSECIVGEDGGMQLYGQGKWYYHYQPTKFVIGNYQLGSEAEFVDLCKEAHKLGMNIIVDAVVNHCSMTYDAIDSSVKNIAGGAFHKMDGMWWSQDDRYHETQGALGGLWDLNTQNPNVQSMIKTFLQNCVKDGADGFRYDTAKLIELPDDKVVSGYPAYASNFWSVVLDNGAKFQYGENLQDAADLSVCRLPDYAKIMDVTASKYGERIRSAVNTDDLSVNSIQDYLVDDVDPSSLVTWVESHDNYCNEKSWSYIDEQESVQAWAIIAARKGGTPLYFSRPEGSTTDDPWGRNLIGVEGSDLYKDNQIVQVNFFRNEMGTEPEYLSNPNNNNKVLMIERGNKGCVIVNTQNSDVNIASAASKMADGKYTDKVSGSTFTVAAGKISGTVKSGRVAVIYNREGSSLDFTSDVSLSVATSNYYTDTLDVTLTAKNCKAATYQIDDATPQKFIDGTVITIGKGLMDSKTVTVRLSATGNDNSTCTAVSSYTKCISDNSTKVYLDKKAFPTWGDVYAYIYNDAGTTNADWPGVKMSSIGNSIYSYTVPYNLEKGTSHVIFNNGYSGVDNQYPAEDGLTIESKTKMMLNYIKEWEVFPLKTLYFKNTQNWSKVNAYYWGSETTEWPGVPAAKVEGTDDIYCITLFGDLTKVIFNNGDTSQTQDIECFMEGQIFTPSDSYTLDQYSQKIYSGTLSQYIDIGLGEMPAGYKQIYLRNTTSWFEENDPDVYVNIDQDKKIKMTRAGKSFIYTAYVPASTDSVYFTRCKSDGTIYNNMNANSMGSYNCYTVTGTSKGTWNNYGSSQYPDSWTVYFDNSTANYSSPYIFAWGGDGLDGFAKMNYVSGSIFSYTFIHKPDKSVTSFLFNDGSTWGGAKTPDLSYDGIHNMYKGSTWSTYTP